MRVLVVMATALAIISCQGGSDGLSFTNDSFQEKELTEYTELETHGELLRHGPVRVILDSLLILSTNSTRGYEVCVYNTKSASFTKLVSNGRGPGEILGIKDMTIKDDKIFVSSSEDYKMAVLSYDKASGEFSKPNTITLTAQFIRAIPFGQNEFLTLASASSDNRLHIVSDKGITVDTVGVFPSSFVKEEALNNAVFQSFIAVSPDNQRIVTACQDFDVVDIYDNDFNLLHELTGPEKNKSEILILKSEIGTRFIPEPYKKTFYFISTSVNYFYMGYIGIVTKTEEDYRRGARTIYSFDWDGNPKIAYRLPFEIQSFDVDEKNGLIYCIKMANDGDYHLYRVRM